MFAVLEDLHVSGLKYGSHTTGQGGSETAGVSHSENPHHELVLAVEGKVKLGRPRSLEVFDGLQVLGKTKNGLVSGISVDLAKTEREMLGRGIKLSGVAEACNGAELVDGIDGKSTGGRVAVGYKEVARTVGRHDLPTDGTVGDHHVVLLGSDSIECRIWTRKLTLVSVPVLSEQMTDTDPRVSTVLSDLHRILFLRIMLALMVRLAVRAMGRPSGMKATATETHETMRVGTLIQPG